MRSLVRSLTSSRLLRSSRWPSASAAKKPKAAAWAAKHQLTGSWKAKDADKDGLKNLKEFKLGTNPRKADTDKDGLKDGDEVKSGNNPLKADTRPRRHQGRHRARRRVTAFDGETITIREFNGRQELTATLDTECTPALDEDAIADDSVADDDDASTTASSTSDDDGSRTSSTRRAASSRTTDEETRPRRRRGRRDDDDGDLEKGDVLQSAELEATATSSPTSLA